VVFENMEDYHARIDDPDLDIDENSVIVLKGVGPEGQLSVQRRVGKSERRGRGQ